MTTLYVDNIAPNLQSSVAIPGHVIQTVIGTTQTGTTNTTSATPVNTNLTATITPSSTANKIIIHVDGQAYVSTGAGGVAVYVYNGTEIVNHPATDSSTQRYSLYTYGNEFWAPVSIHCVDSPNTTSAVTYTIQISSYTAGSAVNFMGGSTKYKSTIILQEIAG
jgi:hypothetical protein